MAFSLAISRRKLFFAVQSCALFLLVVYLTITFNRLRSASHPVPGAHHVGFSATDNGRAGDGPGAPKDNWVPPSQAKHFADASRLLPSILDPSNTWIDRMTCPAMNETRYGYLRADPDSGKHEYVFALNIREAVDLTPRLLGSIIEAITFLGPKHCALSIVEGNSHDGTLEVLRLLAGPLAKLGVAYWLVSSPLDPSAGDRIKKLAILRALAIEPVTGTLPPKLRDAETNDKEGRIHPPQPHTYWNLPRDPLTNTTLTDLRASLSPTATVFFINDVAACTEDFLELAHQRRHQSADMVCAMDWAHNGETYTSADPIFFYDVWIARTMSGNIFFDIDPSYGSWEKATDLFPHDPLSRARMAAGLPFQVFACWNGAIAFGAAPLANHEMGFRASRKLECEQGEAQLFCKDLWLTGHGKIAVVPSVNLQYTDARGRQTKMQKGYVSEFVRGERGHREPAVGGEESLDLNDLISWKGPPEKVMCMPTFGDQTWRAWDENSVDSDLDV